MIGIILVDKNEFWSARFRFPHSITFVMNLLNFVRIVMMTIPILVGRDQLMCVDEDEFFKNLLHTATAFCQTQGKHFSVTAVLFT
jgi:hypothetical protein